MTDKTVHDLYKLTSSEYSKNNKAWYETNPLFWVILVQTGMFYSLPTIQMVLDSSRIFTITGNQDYCYYNSLCQRPLGDLRDFNHIFSNLGYVVLGCMFHYIVYKKEENEKLLDSSLGIPRQYSLYYAMGHSLIGIGVMSSCYHVCPTTITFQFDTTYMYLLAFFMIIKIYQSRHPDLVCSAFRGFLFLGVCLVFEACSLYFTGSVIRILFTVFFVGTLFSMSIYTYTNGEVRMDYKAFFNATTFVYHGLLSGEMGWFQVFLCPRKMFITLLILTNLSFCFLFSVHDEKGISEILLFTFIGNLMFYLSYYVIMKLYCGERLAWHCVIFLLLDLLCVFPALYFFTQLEKNPKVSAAKSRGLNCECTFLGFFDQHDLWHFLGGYGLFFMFMFLLSLDDNCLHDPRDQIPVF